MGMYDESWCSSCGKSQPYSDEEVTCGECAQEESGKLINYMKIHLLSLEQDSEKINAEMNLIEDWGSKEYRDLEIEDISLNGQMIGVSHILRYAKELGLDN